MEATSSAASTCLGITIAWEETYKFVSHPRKVVRLRGCLVLLEHLEYLGQDRPVVPEPANVLVNLMKPLKPLLECGRDREHRIFRSCLINTRFVDSLDCQF